MILTPEIINASKKMSLSLNVDDEQKELVMTPGDNVIKLFTAVFYHHSMVIPSFCVIKLYYLGNYSEMAVNYHGILTLEKVRLKLLPLIDHSIIL